MSIEPSELLPAARDIVLEAGEIIRRDILKPKDVTLKGRIDLVTQTDLAVERFLKEKLHRLLPEAGFLAEESAKSLEHDRISWIIDPVDGTTNFVHGFPFVATSVGLWVDDEVVLGVVNVPVMGEMFSAAKGTGAFLNHKPIMVSEATALDQSIVGTGFPYAIEEHMEQVLGNMRRVLLATQGVRRPGAAAIDLAYTACGRLDGFYETALKPWDVAAGWLLVEEAGGLVSGYDWRERYSLGAPTILATNGRIHHDLSNLLDASGGRGETDRGE